MSSDENLVDLVNRDPNNLNDDVKIDFHDILGEPDEAHAHDCVWVNSYKCFNCCKHCCYKLLTAICGIPLAICWGLEYAMIIFVHVWYVTPCMRCYLINLACIEKIYTGIMQCYCRPMITACSYCFYNIRILKASE